MQRKEVIESEARHLLFLNLFLPLPNSLNIFLSLPTSLFHPYPSIHLFSHLSVPLTDCSYPYFSSVHLSIPFWFYQHLPTPLYSSLPLHLTTSPYTQPFTSCQPHPKSLYPSLPEYDLATSPSLNLSALANRFLDFISPYNNTLPLLHLYTVLLTSPSLKLLTSILPHPTPCVFCLSIQL